MDEIKVFDFVVVGGGIAGISTIEQVDVQKQMWKILLLIRISNFVFRYAFDCPSLVYYSYPPALSWELQPQD